MTTTSASTKVFTQFTIFQELNLQFSYYHVLTKRTSQGEQIALLCKTLKASVLYTERQGCRNSKLSVSRIDRFSLL